MARIVWKGAISFGLVNIPVVLHPGARTHALDFDWIDRRDFSAVGYRRINKRTGKEVQSADIVKGYEVRKGEYVLMSDEDFRQANVAATQTVELTAFVDVGEIAPYHFDTPYFLAPDKRGEKGYVLLRETMRRTGKAGIAYVVLHARQHLAALLVVGEALVLNTIRFADEIADLGELDLPARDASAAGLAERELAMARRLVDDMSETWSPQQYRDRYRDDLMARIESKDAGGQAHQLAEADGEASGATTRPRSADVVDLVELLKRSVGQRGHSAADAPSRPDAKRSTPKPSEGRAAARPSARAAPRTPAAADAESGPARRRKPATASTSRRSPRASGHARKAG